MGTICIKCGYERQESDTAPDYECPKCGVIYAKAKVTQPTDRPKPVKAAPAAIPQNRNLILCKHCGKEVSKAANTCPHCGVSNPGMTTGNFLIAIILLLGFLWFMFSFLVGGSSDEPAAASASDLQQQRERAAMSQCEMAAKAASKYPGTVDIKWFQGVHAIPMDGDAIAVKMEFTAKNAFGADLPFRATCLVNHQGELVTSQITSR